MVKEDLKVGMVIERNGNNVRKISLIGSDVYIYTLNGSSDFAACLSDLGEWEPVVEKKKVTVYNHVYFWGSEGVIGDSGRTNQSWDQFHTSGYRKLIHTFVEEFEVDV